MEECEPVGRACLFARQECIGYGARWQIDIAQHHDLSLSRFLAREKVAVFLSNKSIRGMAQHQKERQLLLLLLCGANAASYRKHM